MDDQRRQPLEEQINQLKKEVAAVAGTVSDAAANQLENAQEKASEAASGLERRVRKDPITSVAVAAGVGLLIGALISR